MDGDAAVAAAEGVWDQAGATEMVFFGVDQQSETLRKGRRAS